MALDVREQLARIDRALADRNRGRQEIGPAPWVPIITGLAAGAALFAAGALFAKFVGG